MWVLIIWEIIRTIQINRLYKKKNPPVKNSISSENSKKIKLANMSARKSEKADLALTGFEFLDSRLTKEYVTKGKAFSLAFSILMFIL